MGINPQSLLLNSVLLFMAHTTLNQPMAPLDRRHQDRSVLVATITMESESNFFTGFSENISEGGIFVSSENPPPVGDTISVEIAIDDGLPIRVGGEVRWHRLDADGRVTGCGVKFIGLERHISRQLQGMLYQSPQVPLLVEEG